MRVRFGEFTLDSRSRELLRGGNPVHLTGKAFRLLEVLVENRPNALSKDELQDRIWPGVFVSEANLTSLITELRRAIGENARSPKFIRTVYGHGYAFSGQALESDAAASRSRRSGVSRYRLRWGRREIVLVEGENILGRGPESVEWIEGVTVSRRHARITVDVDGATLEDLGSKNGTFLHDRRVEGLVPLADGDEIRLGSAPPFTVRVRADPGSTFTKSKRRS